ncbi:MAG TPA: class I SAM-dependent methyltransferase [Dehalococcoidia bacterium]|nr:class I SAM-dependent methyltransferase [Dehalococcoidia bacterium]
MELYDVITGCRSCGSPRLEPILSLGTTPLADGLIDAEALERPEPRFPLDVAFCEDCSLVQILATVRPEMLFGTDYPYFSSFSPELLRHSRENAESLTRTRNLGPRSLVVEIASNDGYLLRNFVEAGIPVLGIDPAPGPARAAEAAGVRTMCTFFDLDLAERLAGEGTQADVVIGNNVLAHVPDQNAFIAGIARLLKHDGVAVIEVPYVRDLIERCEFDTIYHEHHCYFSVTALVRLFARHGLSLNHVEHYPIHGGSLRLFVEPREDVGISVRRYLREEADAGLTHAAFYRDFAARVERTRDSLVQTVTALKAQGRRIAAYGAAAKGATLLNYTGIDSEIIDFVVDRNVHKQGRYMPGVRIPIADPCRLMEDRPDYVLMLAWNFKDEILNQQEAYRALGGRFIVPIPEPVII